jgi:hypothetical protein
VSDLEKYVEYHGWFLLKNAINSHATGHKVQFRLRDEDDLNVFKGITKRRKGHAGQIYRMNYRRAAGDKYQVTDAFFLGATWSHNSGAVVAFEVADVEMWESFRRMPALAQGKDVEAEEFEVILFRVGEDGQLIDLQKRGKIEAIEQLKGGAQSVRAARLCMDGEFLDYLTAESLVESTSTETAVKYIKETAEIKSRKELDHDPAALIRFNALVMSPFNRWRVNQ